ncbi:putative TITAN-like protein [Sesbania bispinosa]|nr:putative TITAN-like protein [Sesbania bispinosa]
MRSEAQCSVGVTICRNGVAVSERRSRERSMRCVSKSGVVVRAMNDCDDEWLVVFSLAIVVAC